MSRFAKMALAAGIVLEDDVTAGVQTPSDDNTGENMPPAPKDAPPEPQVAPTQETDTVVDDVDADVDEDGEVLDSDIDDEVEDTQNDIEAHDEEETDIEALQTMLSVADKHGLDGSQIALAQRLGLLDGTSLATMSCEGLTDADLQLSYEGIVDTIKEKVSSFTAGAMARASKLAEGVKSKLTAAVDWVVSKTGRTGEKVRDTAQAHPYATTAAAIAAMTAAGVAIAYFAGGLSGESLKSFVKSPATLAGKIRDWVKNIKWPWGKVEVKGEGAKVRLLAPPPKKLALPSPTEAVGKTHVGAGFTAREAYKTGTAVAVRGNTAVAKVAGKSNGWDGASVKRTGGLFKRAADAVIGGLSKFWSAIKGIPGAVRGLFPKTTVTDIGGGLSEKTRDAGGIAKAGKAVSGYVRNVHSTMARVVDKTTADGGSRFAAWTIVGTIVGSIYACAAALVTGIVWGTVKLVKATINKLSGGGSSEEAAA